MTSEGKLQERLEDVVLVVCTKNFVEEKVIDDCWKKMKEVMDDVKKDLQNFDGLGRTECIAIPKEKWVRWFGENE